jgi:hypothetical protein
MRDKNHLPLGDRHAIDALIATHTTIWDAENGILFVSKGPAIAGPFIGFNLAKSFESHGPMITGELPPDPEVSVETYRKVKGGK